jgi:hypothetical protein
VCASALGFALEVAQPPRRSHGSSLDDTRGFCWGIQCCLRLYAVVISQKCCPAEHC